MKSHIIIYWHACIVSKKTTQTPVIYLSHTKFNLDSSTFTHNDHTKRKLTCHLPVTYLSDRGSRSIRPHTLSYTDRCLQNMASHPYSDHSQTHSQGRTCTVYNLEYQKVQHVTIIIIITIQRKQINSVSHLFFTIELNIF